jgi:hypothetical protein
LFIDGTWKKLSVRIGGSPMIHIPDGRFVAADNVGTPEVRASDNTPIAGMFSGAGFG